MTEFNRNFERHIERIVSVKKLRMFTKPGRQFVINFFTELKEAAQPYGDMD